MDLFNSEAKKVFKLNKGATSINGVALVSGAPVMNYDKLTPMCSSATTEFLDDLGKRLPKLARKADKSLQEYTRRPDCLPGRMSVTIRHGLPPDGHEPRVQHGPASL